MNEDFSQNLRLLCTYYKSIADVTRKLGISRPQFNRYLNGRYRPAASILRRICEFFGVEEHEILLPHSQFKRIVQVRPRRTDQSLNLPETEHLERLKQLNGSELEKYLGFYFEYYFSMAVPGKILRSLVCIEKRDGGFYYQRTERLIPIPSQSEETYHCKYLGMAHFLSDRIFLMDYESLTANEMTQTILFPTFKSRVTRLQGLRLGVSASGERMPCCARVVMEYLGQHVDIRQALRICGLYENDSEEIDANIRQTISNKQSDQDWHFRARFS